MNPRAPALRFIFLTLLLDVLGFGVIIPVAPSLVQGLQGGTVADAAPVVSWLTVTYAAMLFLFAPVLGALSDRFGRRPVLLVALFGSGLDYLAMALVPTVPWLFVTRALNGLSGASITVASAYIADVTPPEKRAAGFGVVGAAFGIGFVLGPLLGGVLGKIDVHYPFYAAGVITLCNWLYGWFVLPESLPKAQRRPVPFRWDPFAGIAVLRRQPPFVFQLAMAQFLFHIAQFGLHVTWVLHGKFRYGWDERDAGLSLFAVGLGAALVQGGLARRLIPRLGEPRALVLGLGFGVLAYAGYGLASTSGMLYVAIALGALGGLAMPAAQALVTKAVRNDEQGAVQGGLTSLQGLANIAGPLLGGAVFTWSIGPAVAPPWPGAYYLLCAVLGLCGTGLAAVALRRRHG